MREILFRGKRINNGKWVEGYLIILTRTEAGSYICFHSKHEWIEVKVIPETVGQFTGLTDIKNNKRKVFEGDIYKHKTLVGVVTWNKTLCQYQLSWTNMNTAADLYYMINSDVDFNYLGNIHDNPELIP